MSYTDSENPDKKYYELAEKLLNGSITPEEEEDFSAWYNSLEDKPVIIPSTFAGSENELKGRIWDKINKTRKQDQRLIRPRIFFYSASAAAVLILLAMVSYWFVPSTSKKVATAKPVTNLHKELVQPQDKAVLTLADGSHILLDDAVDGTLTEQGLTKVIKLKSGQLLYKSISKQGNTDTRFNTVSTPHGGQYQIVLPDSTIVLLNTASSLRFPTAFTANERRVELTGEAYFEVARNKEVPFKVTVGDMEIAVLGTHFNVMGYSEEKEVKTTLMEGSVNVKSVKDQKVLKPGEQASLEKSAGTLQVAKKVNIKQVIAWKEGNFYFENANIETIMLQISHWYNVKVLYKGTVPDMGFSGIISRTKNLSQIMEILEAANRVHFTLQGNELTVISN